MSVLPAFLRGFPLTALTEKWTLSLPCAALRNPRHAAASEGSKVCAGPTLPSGPKVASAHGPLGWMRRRKAIATSSAASLSGALYCCAPSSITAIAEPIEVADGDRGLAVLTRTTYVSAIVVDKIRRQVHASA